MNKLFFSLLLLSCGAAYSQNNPIPIAPSKGTSTNINPGLFTNNPDNLFRYFQFQLDTDSAYNTSFAYTSAWSTSSAFSVNYDSMQFQQKYYWRVRARKATGTDTTSWSYSNDFFTGLKPRFSTSFKNTTSTGPVASISITGTGAKKRIFETDTALNFSSPLLKTDTLASTNLQVTGMLFGKKYYVRCRDLTAISISPYSDTATITVQTNGTTFDYPDQNLSIYPPKFFVKLTANQGLSQFETEHDTSLQFNSPLYVKNAFSGTLIFSGNDLLADQKYYMRVRAINNGDTSGWSVVRQVTTARAPLLSKPANNSGAVSTTALLEINGPKGTMHNVQLDTASSFSSGYLKEFSVTSVYDSSNSVFKIMTVNPGALNFGKKYYYRSRFYNSVDTSLWTNAYNFTTLQPATFLYSPPDGAQHLDEQVNFSWNSVKGIGGYHLVISKDSFATVYKERFINSPDSFFTYFTLESNTVYFARLRMFNQIDTTQWLNVTKFRTRLPFVEKVSPADSAGILNDSIPLKWRSAGAGMQYEIGIWSNKDLTVKVLTDSTTDTLYYFHPTLRGKIFFWDVKASLNGYKDPSWYFNQQRNFVPLLAAPVLTSPAQGAAEQPYASLSLKWNAVPGAKGYKVEVSLEPSFTGALAGDVPVNNAVLSGLPASTFHYWRVRAYQDYYSPYSDVFTFITKATPSTAVAEMRFVNNTSIEVYPNPFTETFSVFIPEHLRKNKNMLKLYDVNGRLLKEMTFAGDREDLDVRELPAGVYMYRVIHADGTAQGRLIKK